MTMRDLAKLCNVSVSTVSKAFYDADDVSEDTKKLIFDIARENGVYGKFYKGKYHKKIIALICPELEGNHYSDFVNRLKKLIEKSGGMCVISTDDFSESKQSELIEYFASYLKVDGIIVFGLRKNLKKGYDVPIVSLFSSHDDNVDSINIDMKSAIDEAVNTLHLYGHKKIAFIVETLTASKSQYFENAMHTVGSEDATIILSKKRFEKAGIDGINQLLEAKKEFTASICGYDNIAFGAIKQLKKCGLRVPEDISVIGIDNISLSEYTETSLTSIDIASDELCRSA